MRMMMPNQQRSALHCPGISAGRDQRAEGELAATRNQQAVLIISNDPVARAIQAALEDAGMTATVVEAGNGLLPASGDGTPDLVLLDLDASNSESFDLCRTLQADPYGWHAPVILMSASEDIPRKVQALESG